MVFDNCHFHSVLTYNSGYASLNHDGKLLLVSNLKDGIDEFQFPSLEKVQTFTHPIETNCILQTRSLPLGNLIVTGGNNGFARVFNQISSQLVTVLLLHKDSVRSVTIKRDLVYSGEAEGKGATQA